LFVQLTIETMQRILMTTTALVTVILAAPVAADDPAKGGVAVALQFSECAGLYYAAADLGPEFARPPDDVQLAPGQICLADVSRTSLFA
jgi:hypothetical protein